MQCQEALGWPLFTAADRDKSNRTRSTPASRIRASAVAGPRHTESKGCIHALAESLAISLRPPGLLNQQDQ